LASSAEVGEKLREADRSAIDSRQVRWETSARFKTRE
jgi:hypothetical protein